VCPYPVGIALSSRWCFWFLVNYIHGCWILFRSFDTVVSEKGRGACETPHTNSLQTFVFWRPIGPGLTRSNLRRLNKSRMYSRLLKMLSALDSLTAFWASYFSVGVGVICCERTRYRARQWLLLHAVGATSSRADTTERASQLSADVSFVITRHERHIAAQRCHDSGTTTCWYWQLVHVIINIIIIISSSSSSITRSSDFIRGLHLMTTCCSHASLFSRPCARKNITELILTVWSRRTVGNQRPFQKINILIFEPHLLIYRRTTKY